MAQAILKGFAIALLAFVIGSGATAAYRKLYPQYLYTGSQSLTTGNGLILKARDYATPTGNILALRLSVPSKAQAHELMMNSLQNARLVEREILRDDSSKQVGARMGLVYQNTAAQRPITKVIQLKGSSMLVASSYNGGELFVVKKMAASDFDF